MVSKRSLSFFYYYFIFFLFGEGQNWRFRESLQSHLASVPHEAPPCPTLLGKIHEGSQRPRQSCASRSLHAPVPMGQLHVPKRQHQTSHFPSSQPAQERTLNTSPQLEQARCLGGPETHFTTPNFAPFQGSASCNKEAAGMGMQFISGFPQRSPWGSSFGTPRAHNPLRSFRSPRIRCSSLCTPAEIWCQPFANTKKPQTPVTQCYAPGRTAPLLGTPRN